MFLNLATGLAYALLIIIVICVLKLIATFALIIINTLRSSSTISPYQPEIERTKHDQITSIKTYGTAVVAAGLMFYPYKYMVGSYLRNIEETAVVLVDTSELNGVLAFKQDLQSVGYSKGRTGSHPTKEYRVEIFEKGEQPRRFIFAKDSRDPTMYWITFGLFSVGYVTMTSDPFELTTNRYSPTLDHR